MNSLNKIFCEAHPPQLGRKKKKHQLLLNRDYDTSVYSFSLVAYPRITRQMLR